MARMSRFLISAAIVGIAVAGNFEQEKEAQPGCIPVNHINDNPGSITCDCVDSRDQCLQDGECVKEPLCVDFEQEEEEEEQSDCGACVTTFMAGGGCDDFDNEALVPPGCDDCGAAAWKACGKPGDFEQEEEEEQSDCENCVTTFMAGGGCDDFDNEALVPPGCDDCGAAAWKACGKPGDFEQEEEEEQSASVDCSLVTDQNTCISTDAGDYSLCSWNRMAKTCEHCMTTCLTEFYFINNEETSLCECMGSEKAKSCTSETKALYGSMFCTSGPEEPESPDVCVGLKKQKCNKQDMCEYKNKQCISTDEPIDVCVGLKKKKCKKQDTCEFKKKQCISIDEPIDVCVGLRKKQCKKQEGVCKFKKKTKECAMI